MLTVLKYVLILCGVIALAWLVAWGLRKWRGDAMSGQLTNIVLIVGFVLGFLLTTLQVFATNHYSDARTQAQSEATTLVAMYDNLGVFPPQVAAPAQHDLVCYMRSVAGRDWIAQERGNTEEARDSVVRGDRLRSLRATLPQDSPAEMAAYQQVSTALSDAGTARQKVLFDAQPQVPTILWVLVFVGAAVLFFLLISDSEAQGSVVRRTVLIAVTVLMIVEVGSLAAVDRPFSPTARIQPTSMTSALALLETGRHGDPIFRDCGPTPTVNP